VALGEALLVAFLSALAWAFLKGVLEFPGALAVAVIGGWLIGEVLWSVRVHPAVAAGVAVATWIAGLVLTWMTAMALLPESTRSFVERLQNTPFLEWLGPQFGWLEVGGLVLYVVAALYGARPRSA
jgi:fructose-specific phosphotransferase system IIC component